MNNDQLTMTENDFQKLSALVDFADPVTSELLQEELDRASVVSTDQLPADVVTMNSRVEFRDLDSRKSFVMTLVFPEQANIEENKISILAPVGAALIGLKVGQVMSWPVPRGGKKRLQVVSVVYQPEADGAEV